MDRRLTAIELALSRMLGIQQIHGEKLDAILEAATAESGPSETRQLLAQIVNAIEQVQATMEGLPAAVGQAVRDGLQESELEEAGPDSFESDDADSPQLQ